MLHVYVHVYVILRWREKDYNRSRGTKIIYDNIIRWTHTILVRLGHLKYSISNWHMEPQPPQPQPQPHTSCIVMCSWYCWYFCGCFTVSLICMSFNLYWMFIFLIYIHLYKSNWSLWTLFSRKIYIERGREKESEKNGIIQVNMHESGYPLSSLQYPFAGVFILWFWCMLYTL